MNWNYQGHYSAVNDRWWHIEQYFMPNWHTSTNKIKHYVLVTGSVTGSWNHSCSHSISCPKFLSCAPKVGYGPYQCYQLWPGPAKHISFAPFNATALSQLQSLHLEHYKMWPVSWSVPIWNRRSWSPSYLWIWMCTPCLTFNCSCHSKSYDLPIVSSLGGSALV
jgi:hypothetical protein